MSVVVVYEEGAVSPTEILRIVGPARPIIVVLAPSDHARRMRPLFMETCTAVYDLDDADLVSRLLAHDITGIVTFSEPMLRPTSSLATELGLIFHNAETVERLTNKEAQRRRLRESAVDSTASTVISSVAQWESVVQNLGLPVVVKPALGVSSRNTILVREPEAAPAQIDRLLREERRLVVEEYLRGIDVAPPFGDYVSVETVVSRGERRHLAVTGKLRLAPPFRECGQFWPARLDTATNEAVVLLADHAVKALDVESGILHTEIKLTPAGPRIIEVNGRIGGYIAELAWRAAAVDLADVAVRIACGEHVDIHPVDCDRVFFQFTTPAPTAHGRVSAVPRRDSLKDIAGIARYYPLVRRGAEVGGIRTHDLDLVAGEAPDHEALAATIHLIMDTISYEFEIAGRPVVRSARDLVDNV